MKKILLAVAAVALLANGCSGQQSASVNPSENSGQTAEVSPAPTPEQASPPAQTQVQAQANVQVNNSDDAVNLLEKDSANEQAQAGGKDDTDLSSSDSADLSSITEVSNGY